MTMGHAPVSSKKIPTEIHNKGFFFICVSSFPVNFIIFKGWCKVVRRLFSLVSAFIVLFFVSVPAFATAVEPGGVGGGIGGIPVVANVNFDVVDLFDYFGTHGKNNVRWLANTAGHFVDEDICPNAPQLGGGHRFTPRRTLKDGQVAMFNVCDYCGKSYGEACQEAYQQYVDTLPGKQVNSDGAFLWTPEYRGMCVKLSLNRASGPWYTYISPVAESFGLSGSLLGSTISANCSLSNNEHSGVFLPPDGVSYLAITDSSSSHCWYYFDYTYPVSGYYSLVSGPQSDWRIDALDENHAIFPAGKSVFHSAGSSDGIKLADYGLALSPGFNSQNVSFFSYTYYDPVYRVSPLDSYLGSSSSFSSDSRPSVSVDASSGDNSSLMLGYMDNGNLVQSQSQSAVFVESSNIYTNPVTNNTKTVINWNYDYVDRSYNLTTEEGDEITVTYGDTNLTINEGGDTYNLYYLTEHDENVQCSHSYSGQITQSPTCTSGGVKTYTCSSCGESYTQELPATGHSYVSSVSTEPTCTASGARTSTCSVCGDTRSEVIPATGHSYVSAVTQEATCTSPGVRTSTCSVCGDVRMEAIPANGHSYTSVVTMEPTCTTTGVKTFTCSACGDSYTRPIPATGHKWHILRTVSNQYGADGQLEQAGYTLYECETCGEQYRIDAATSGTELPNASSEGTSTGTGTGSAGDDTGESDSGVGAGFLLTIARGLTEDLPEVLKMVSQWFTSIPPLFDGYSKFLAASFSWLPKECSMLIVFGVHMVVLIGILKACFRR